MKHLESQLQIVCVRWFKLQYPKLIIAAIPNGGARSKAVGGIMKAEGMLKGFPDLVVCKPSGNYNALFIEMKQGKAKPKKEQKELLERLQGEGYKCAVAYSLDEFRNIITDYLKIK